MPAIEIYADKKLKKLGMGIKINPCIVRCSRGAAMDLSGKTLDHKKRKKKVPKESEKALLSLFSFFSPDFFVYRTPSPFWIYKMRQKTVYKVQKKVRDMILWMETVHESKKISSRLGVFVLHYRISSRKKTLHIEPRRECFSQTLWSTTWNTYTQTRTGKNLNRENSRTLETKKKNKKIIEKSLKKLKNWANHSLF